MNVPIGPSRRQIDKWKRQRLFETVRTRWIQELQVKYNVGFVDEEDFDYHNLLTMADHDRELEIMREEEEILYGPPLR